MRAVGPSSKGDSGDIAIAVDRTAAYKGGPSRAEDVFCLAQGEAALAGLRSNLKMEFARVGNSHWGMETDVKHLASALKIGFMIFSDDLQDNGSKCLVNLNLRSTDFEYMMCLWWKPPVHFRLLEVQVQQNAPWQCFFKASEMPLCLRDHYLVCNRRNNASLM